MMAPGLVTIGRDWREAARTAKLRLLIVPGRLAIPGASDQLCGLAAGLSDKPGERGVGGDCGALRGGDCGGAVIEATWADGRGSCLGFGLGPMGSDIVACRPSEAAIASRTCRSQAGSNAPSR
jgi:hypothetical protein